MTTHVRGAHHAPRRFLDGTLFITEQVRHAYATLRRSTLIVTPEQDQRLVQSFEVLTDLAAQNDAYIQIHTLPTGLLPHWEAPEAFFDLLDDFLA